jgi:hypothetical protein
MIVSTNTGTVATAAELQGINHQARPTRYQYFDYQAI